MTRPFDVQNFPSQVYGISSRLSPQFSSGSLNGRESSPMRNNSFRVSALSRAGRLALETKVEKRHSLLSFASEASLSTDDTLSDIMEEFHFKTVNLSSLTEGIAVTSPSSKKEKPRVSSPSDTNMHHHNPRGMLRYKLKKQCTPQDFEAFQ